MSKRLRPIPSSQADNISQDLPADPVPSAAAMPADSDGNSPPRAVIADDQAVVAVLPASPASNRERFRASQMPSQVSCDLSGVPIEPGHRFTFQGIVLVVFPASANPLRRHILVGDGRGVVGLTVWNTHVNSFSSASIGELFALTLLNRIASENKTSAPPLLRGADEQVRERVQGERPRCCAAVLQRSIN